MSRVWALSILFSFLGSVGFAQSAPTPTPGSESATTSTPPGTAPRTAEEQRTLDIRLSVAVDDGKSLAEIQELLNQGADPNADALTEVALHYSEKPGTRDILELFLRNGGDPNHQRHADSGTPLMYAASFCHPEAVQAMLSRRGNPDQQREGYRPYFTALSRAADAVVDAGTRRPAAGPEKIERCRRTYALLRRASHVSESELQAAAKRDRTVYDQVCSIAGKDREVRKCRKGSRASTDARYRLLRSPLPPETGIAPNAPGNESNASAQQTEVPDHE